MRGSNHSESRIYLKVGYGKFRQMRDDHGNKVTEETPMAVRRESEHGVTFAIEHDYVEGIIKNVFLKEANSFEGKKFPASYEVVIEDGPEVLQISLPLADDAYKFLFPFLEALPNVILDKPVKITVWDYISKDINSNTGKAKRKFGLMIEQNDNPNTREIKTKDGIIHVVTSLYRKYENNQWVYFLGYPTAEGKNFADEDDRKAYNIDVKRFLKAEFEKRFANVFNQPASKEEIDEVIDTPATEQVDDSDLPW